MRRSRALIASLVTACVLGPPMLPAATAPSEFRIRAGTGAALAVAEASRAADFYERVLFFERVADLELPGPDSRVRIVRMRLGEELIELIERRVPGRSLPRVAIVVNDLEQVYLWLLRHRVTVLSPPPRPDWDPQGDELRTVAFRDPDGNPLALVQFPTGRGDGRWLRPTDRVFLGIDASASVDADPRSAGSSGGSGPQAAR